MTNDTTYILTCINNLANSSSGRLAIRRRDTNGIIYSAYLSTTGKKELKFTASSETFSNGWYISIMVTGSTSTTSSIDISNLMLREASIADDTFEPYRIPTDERVYSLDIAAANVSQYVPNPGGGIYWITIADHYSTQNNQFDIYVSTPDSDGGHFFGVSKDYPIPKHEVKLPHFHNYKENAISFGLIATNSDPVMAISSNPGILSSSHTTSMWDKLFGNSTHPTFLDFLDIKDGLPTSYVHIHLCDDGGIRNQADYEAYIGG